MGTARASSTRRRGRVRPGPFGSPSNRPSSRTSCSSWTRAARNRRVAADPQSQAALDLGSGLFDAVFSSDIRLAWARSIDTVRDARRGLRLRLRLTEAPDIAVLPWELLHDRRQNSFIAQSERTPVVRYLEVADTPRTLDVDGPLRILVVIASPTDMPELDVEAEWNRVNAALADRVSQGTVQLDRLEQPHCRPCRRGSAATTSTSCTSSVMASTTARPRTESSTSATGTGAPRRSRPASSAPTYATTTPCA